MSFDMMHMPGPCVVCGDTGYSLSCGGPSICPKCDCGNFDAATVLKQSKVIAALREEGDDLKKANQLLHALIRNRGEEIERQRNALAPFAKLAAVAHPDHKDSRPFIFAFDTAIAQRLTIGDLRRAGVAISQASRDGAI